MVSKTVLRLLILGLLCTGAVVFFLFNPEEQSWFIPCPVKAITGFKCAGCGSQRAIHHLLHFRIGEAFMLNPLLVSAIPYVAFGMIYTHSGLKDEYVYTIRQRLYGGRVIWVWFIVLVGFMVLRNIFHW